MDAMEAKKRIEEEIKRLSVWIMEQEAALIRARAKLNFLKGKLEAINEFADLGDSEK